MVIKRPKLSDKLEFYSKDKRVFATLDKKTYFELPEAAMAIMGLIDGHRTIPQIAKTLTADPMKARELEETITPAVEKMVQIGLARFV